MPDSGFLAVFLVGLLGGVHCAGMCGGIVSALTVQMPAQTASPGTVPAWTLHLAYNLGRITSYAVAGALLGALGSLGLLLNNALTFGDPLSFGQASAGAALVAMKAGHDRVFGDGVWRAALGLLASPSRGLLVFYPALAFSALGLALLARRPALRQKTGLGPAMLSLPLLALFVVPALWFDWWGGWCYGPRLMGDLLPLLGLLFMLGARVPGRGEA